MPDGGGAASESPLTKLRPLAVLTVPVHPGLDHTEMFTSQGLLTILRHGPPDAEQVVVCFGGALGGLLGPDGGLYHRIGEALAVQGIGTIRVSYRQANDLNMCIHDGLAAIEWTARNGAAEWIMLGHSFGGAVAIQCAARLQQRSCPGVVTFATQSAGCEAVEHLADRDLLFIHGKNDRILPHQSSVFVREMAGNGEVVLLDAVDHLMAPAGDDLLDRMLTHLPKVFRC